MQIGRWPLAVICLLLIMGPTLTAQTPSSIHCTVNAQTSRSFADDIGWFGSHPDRSRTSEGQKWDKPDPQDPFQVEVFIPTTQTALPHALFAEYIFSQLDTDTPHIRLIPFSTNSGYERNARVIQRTSDPLAIHFVWEGVPNKEFYTVALNLKSFKAAIGRTNVSNIIPGGVGVAAITADCR